MLDLYPHGESYKVYTIYLHGELLKYFPQPAHHLAI